MAKAGSLNTTVQGTPVLFAPTKAGQLDANTRITSVSNIDTELPIGIRTLGYLYYVEDEDSLYIFKGGVNNTHFVPVVDLLNAGQTVVIKTTVTLTVGTTSVEHGLDREVYAIQAMYGNEVVQVGWSNADTNTNTVELHSNVNLVGVDVTLIFGNTQ